MAEPIKVSLATREQIHAALDAGTLSQVVIYCDVCGFEMASDFIGDTSQERFAAARAYLRANRGWAGDAGQDTCTFCAANVQICHQQGHLFCAHGDEWRVHEGTGWAIHPSDSEAFLRAFKLMREGS